MQFFILIFILLNTNKGSKSMRCAPRQKARYSHFEGAPPISRSNPTTNAHAIFPSLANELPVTSNSPRLPWVLALPISARRQTLICRLAREIHCFLPSFHARRIAIREAVAYREPLAGSVEENSSKTLPSPRSSRENSRQLRFAGWFGELRQGMLLESAFDIFIKNADNLLLSY